MYRVSRRTILWLFCMDNKWFLLSIMDSVSVLDIPARASTIWKCIFCPEQNNEKLIHSYRKKHFNREHAGRHKKLEEHERRCQMCMTDVENESHFVLKCPLYQKLRLKYFGQNLQIADIMKCESKEASFNLANFLSKAYSIKEYCLRMRSYFLWWSILIV